MTNSKINVISRIVVVGDAYVSAQIMEDAVKKLPFWGAEVISLTWGTGDKEEFTEMQTALESKGPDAVPYPNGLEEAIRDADILIVHFCPVPKKLISCSHRLKAVGICRGGTENIAVSALTERKIPLLHIIRNSEAVAEFTLGIMLAETRNIARAHHKICEGKWETQFWNSEFTSTLKNMTVGIIGLGNIGALLAEKLHLLGVSMIGYDTYLREEEMDRLPVKSAETMEEVFQEADIVTVHLRLTAENHGIIGRDLLSLMKPKAYLINVARAGLIEEKALIEILTEHKIAGAALDVFEQEPLPSNHPFMQMDNVTLTPHIAGDTVDSIAFSPYTLAEALYGYFVNGDKKNICNKDVL
ncbi:MULTISPECIES: 2-hydroxyacid dehydrogenase [Lachnospiraceae]|jgi:D-3-phosphoglycerate dehydrogenase|uniref:2-hydroxyacid dehydrogenase n=1 Tax=Faecalicatena acetigenes TaxID=2981790 RepID=A0ABT2T8M7_9FIRM|nr:MULTISPECIES: 2-hydroxyacid dehydrogenase [Lachnospiraceae]MCU6746109.1 2-hydroxyacid dehydrogenase [Faecalicatena acetigenes]RGT74961.1 phosphoglycerate dehydrogenase [Ruminococcus sp. AF18-22]SCG95730.1 Glyoxylate/hydroxypyruvate reductase B [uncultured Clostridium sp.]